jgi:hypothetical protein
MFLHCRSNEREQDKLALTSFKTSEQLIRKLDDTQTHIERVFRVQIAQHYDLYPRFLKANIGMNLLNTINLLMNPFYLVLFLLRIQSW